MVVQTSSLSLIIFIFDCAIRGVLPQRLLNRTGIYNRVIIPLYIAHLYHKHVRRNEPSGMVNTVAL